MQLMKKFKLPGLDAIILGALFALMLAWGPFYAKFIATPPPPVRPGVASTNAVSGGATGSLAVAASRSVAAAVQAPELRASTPEAGTNAAAAAPAPVVPAPAITVRHASPEQKVTLSNGVMRLTLTSWGGGIAEAELSRYPVTRKNEHEPVALDFTNAPALTYEGLPGLDAAADYAITVVSNGTAARLEARADGGLRFIRTVTLTERYQVRVEDAFVNGSAAAVAMPAHALMLGSMRMLKGESVVNGMAYLGIDTLPSTGGEGVRFWSRKGTFSSDLTMADYFDEEPRRGHGCVGKPGLTHPLPTSIRQHIGRDMDWVAVKNKFFVQILAPRDGTAGVDLIVDRKQSPGEMPDDPRTWDAAAVPARVAAAACFAPRSLAPGETYKRSMSYYVGPKEISSLRALGNHQANVMDFGMFKVICEGLLWLLTLIYSVLPNYGVAIIILTLLVRIVFWPLTHKGTESMKRMQAIQPKLTELKEKYKDKPQKLQQETMALYKEHKINPLGGCLPMLIQIPVFFALFNVLRSAVEMRFAPFLWVGDLSEPEGLLAGMLPFGLSLNILPLLMAATQAWQQHLTPSGGDPAQQKMMMFMPVIMLMFLYNMPAALVLYWTANQVLMIVQLLRQKRMAPSLKPA